MGRATALKYVAFRSVLSHKELRENFSSYAIFMGSITDFCFKNIPFEVVT
jgi:hypothetical protein